MAATIFHTDISDISLRRMRNSRATGEALKVIPSKVRNDASERCTEDAVGNIPRGHNVLLPKMKIRKWRRMEQAAQFSMDLENCLRAVQR
jgi:hypothetical protein